MKSCFVRFVSFLHCFERRRLLIFFAREESEVTYNPYKKTDETNMNFIHPKIHTEI